MSTSHRAPGRRRAPGRVKRLPDGFPRLGASWATKSAAGLCVVGGAAVALAVPAGLADAEAGTADAPVVDAAAVVLAGRTAPPAASRALSERRRALTPAVAAPDGSAPVRPDSVGVAGVKAVAKPTPKPTPSASATAAGTAAVATGTWSGGTTGKCTSIGLIPNAVAICSAVDSTFGPPVIGGRRNSNDEHGTGQAIDFMIANAAQGDAIAAWVQAHVAQFNVKYLIWQQRYWAPGEGWSAMADRGSPTANHYDHVHVTVNY